MIVRGRLTALPADTPVPNGTTGDLRRAVDASLITTVVTTDGWYTYEANGNPGPFYVEWVYGGVTHRSYSKITGPSAATEIGNMPVTLHTFTNGIIDRFGSELTLTATGATMNVTVATGAALVQGILYDRVISGTLAIAASHATLGRLDYVVVRVVPRFAGESIEGKSELVILTGTAAATPALPALTQTSALYEFPIGSVTVDAAVTTIASNKVSYFSASLAGALPPLLGVTSAHLADSSVTSTKIGVNSIGNSKLADNSITSAKIVDGTIVTADMADGAITSVKLGTNSVGALALAPNTVASSNIIDGTIVTADLADSAITTAKILNATILGADIAASTITSSNILDGTIVEEDLAAAVQTKLNAAGKPSLMPGTEIVATGTLSIGSTRTLYTLAVGPLLSGTTYDIAAFGGVTARNNGNTGTIVTKMNINGGIFRTHEWQNVGGVPRWTEIKQSDVVVGAGVTVDVLFQVTGQTGDTTDIRAGELFVMAIPR